MNLLQWTVVAWLLGAGGQPVVLDGAEGRILKEPAQTAWLRAAELRPPAERVRIASYNIQDFTDSSGDGKHRTLEKTERQARHAAAILDEIGADIVVLQEIENPRALAKLNTAMAKPYPAGYITRFEPVDGPNKLNVAVLTRLPAAEVREVDFAHTKGGGRPPRGFLRAVFDLGGDRRLAVYGVHLKSNYGTAARNLLKRSNAMRLVVEDAEALRTRNAELSWEILVAGDMNSDPTQSEFADDPTLKPLDGWVDLWEGVPLAERVTLPTRYGDPAKAFRAATFDRFYASPELTSAPWRVGRPAVLPRGCDTNNVLTLPGENNLHVSDHYPVYVDLAP